MEKQDKQIKKQLLTGKIVNLNSGKDTISVEVETLYRHSTYEKQMKQHKRFLAHLAEERKADYGMDQEVTIESTKPYSRRKSWRVVLAKQK